MPRDFASRRRRKPAKRRATPRSRVFFHSPSFAFGALVGAAIIVLISYAPEWLDSQAQSTAQTPQAAQKPAVIFDFPQMLSSSEVPTQPGNYPVPPPEEEAPARDFNIQAASFRTLGEAEQLRANLLLQNLPAATTRSLVRGETWYRVQVGPFARRVEADRAMTRLREQNLGAIWINVHD
ncbi:MAG: SPOR domain-containing protein [Pseudomonadota bacterium]